MENMRGRVLRKLNSISNATWYHPLQPFHPSNLVEKHKNHHHNPPIRTGQSFGFSEAPLDTKEQITTPSMNTADTHKDQEKLPFLMSDLEHKCPPGGKDILVLYTTSLRGIRKTFEDCNTVRFLLESFRVSYSERDVSMHMEYRDELWGVLGGRVVPPRLFVRGRYIGGADEVVGLHEKGKLKKLLHGIPLSVSSCPCGGCGGVRFVLCVGCSGSRKVVDSSGVTMRCCDCNENGLVKCSVCS